MEPGRIVELLEPFLSGAALSAFQLNQISTYINILERWNARTNLTAVRGPEEIVTRHFGESLFAASHIFPAMNDQPPQTNRLTDVGSGAGFPGLPIKIWSPEIALTLIESNHKKATFLREVCRALTLTNVDVFSGRAEDYFLAQADVVTLRAVEQFDSVLPVAARLVAPGGRLVLLIGLAQAESAHRLAPAFSWDSPAPMPNSTSRILLIGRLP